MMVLIDKEQRKYNPVYNSPVIGYCEQDPNVYFNYLVDACKTLTNNHQDLLNDIIGVVLTTFRDTAVFLDEKMNILRPSILWLDQRNSSYQPKLSFLKNFLFSLVGMKPVIKYQQQKTMSHWVKKNQPEIWNKVYKYVNISTYLNYLLTGNLADTVSSLAGHYPINYKKGNWYDKFEIKQGIFDIP